ncbi:hypothetical protein HYT05_01570, partial [Candidatus Kaiserbacteria bacterium]|nr:hypothetical protein [Candidatus Kaiserbacteria bacterium]
TSKKGKYDLGKDAQEQLEHLIDPGVVLKALKKERVVAPDTLWKDIPFYHPEEGDGKSGYAGRVGIYEVLPVTATIKELIMQSATGDAIGEQARKEGMLSMTEDGIFKAAQGLTSIEEVMRVITE